MPKKGCSHCLEKNFTWPCPVEPVVARIKMEKEIYFSFVDTSLQQERPR